MIEEYFQPVLVLLSLGCLALSALGTGILILFNIGA